MPKQFAKDVPRMVRVDGRRPGGEGASADERVAAAARAVQEACGRLKGAEGKRALGRNVGEVMALATQGLGIALYEATLERYKRKDPSVAVMQAGHHYIDLETGAGAGGAGRGPAVTVVAYFKLHKADDLAVPPWLLQALAARRHCRRGNACRVLAACQGCPRRNRGSRRGGIRRRA